MPKLRPRRRGLLAALAALAALAPPAAASAGELVAAENMTPSGAAVSPVRGVAGPDGAPRPYESAAQTFEAQATGALSRIDLLVSESSVDAGLRVSLMAADPFAPAGTAPADELVGATVAPGRTGPDGLVSVTFDAGPRLVAGRRYVVALSSTTTGGVWGWVRTARHPDGMAFIWNTELGFWEPLHLFDEVQHAFRVVVQTPYAFGGFRAPLAGGDGITVVKAGRAVPVKFSLGGVATATLRSASSRPVPCDAAAHAEETVAGEVPADGPRGLVYDGAADEYSYVWRTDPAWAGSCRELALTLDDGIARTARLRFPR